MLSLDPLNPKCKNLPFMLYLRCLMFSSADRSWLQWDEQLLLYSNEEAGYLFKKSTYQEKWFTFEENFDLNCNIIGK